MIDVSMRSYLFRILIILCIVVHSIPGRVHMGTVHIFGRDRAWYYILTALAWLPAAVSFHYFDRNFPPDRRFLRVFIWVIINSLSNELFFDPIHATRNDLLFAGFIILVEVFHSLIITLINRIIYVISRSNS